MQLYRVTTVVHQIGAQLVDLWPPYYMATQTNGIHLAMKALTFLSRDTIHVYEHIS